MIVDDPAMGVQDVPTRPLSGPSSYRSPYSDNTFTQGAAAPSEHRKSKKRKGPDAQVLGDGPFGAQSEVIDLTNSPPKKRKMQKSRSAHDENLDDLEGSSCSRKKPKKAKDEEKRLRRWRAHPPTTYLEVKDRALT